MMNKREKKKNYQTYGKNNERDEKQREKQGSMMKNRDNNEK